MTEPIKDDGAGYKIQLSKKVNGDLWNIRANSAEEFRQIVEDLAGVADSALSSMGEVVQAVLAKGVQTEEFSEPETKKSYSGGRKSTSGGPPKCRHGEMKDLAEKNYKHRYYCTARSRDEQCDPRD